MLPRSCPGSAIDGNAMAGVEHEGRSLDEVVYQKVLLYRNLTAPFLDALARMG